MEEIKRCPFCGNSDPYWDSILIDDAEEHFLMCSACGCEGPHHPVQMEAATLWNNRLEPAQGLACLECLQARLREEQGAEPDH